jgi:GntR family transcriptional regulator
VRLVNTMPPPAVRVQMSPLEFRRGRGITVAGVPERGAVVARARELVRFAREQGYPIDELIQIIESVG